MDRKDLIKKLAGKYSKRISLELEDNEETLLETEIICKDEDNELAFVVVDSE
jgi:hypothetical protein